MLKGLLRWVFDHPAFAIFLGWALFNALQNAAKESAKKRRQAPAPPPMPGPRPPPPPPAPAPAAVAPAARRALAIEARIDAAATELATQRAMPALASDPTLTAAADVLIARCADAGERTRTAAQRGDTAALAALAEEVDALVHATHALGLAAAQRSGGARSTLELVDGLAARLLEAPPAGQAGMAVAAVADKPLVPFAARRHLPVAFLAVPPHLDEHPSRWAFVVRAAIADRIQRDASLSAELGELLGGPDPDRWEDPGHVVACRITRSWSSDLAADAALAHVLGPAWGEALVAETLLQPTAARFTLRPGAPASAFGGHVTGAIRVEFVLAVLDRAGWSLEAAELADRWDAASPGPQDLALRTETSLDMLPREIFVEHCGFMADRLATTPISSLGGTLGRAFAPERATGLVADSQAQRAGLLAGNQATAPLRVLLSALAGLTSRSPVLPSVRAAVEASLRSALERPTAPPARRDQPATRPVRRAVALRQAFVLGEALTPFEARLTRPAW